MKLVTAARAPAVPSTEASPKDVVLYVEDEEPNRQIAEQRLRNHYELLIATNDREACEIVRQTQGQLCAILMDIQLKGSQLDGIKLTKLFRGTLAPAETPAFAQDMPVIDTPILFVTAFAEVYKESELLSLGGNRLITKPVDFSQLALALTHVHLQRTLKR